MKLRHGKLPIIAGIVLLTASLSSASGPSDKKPAAKQPSSKAQKSARTAHKTSGRTVHSASKKSRRSRTRGQQAIDGDRTREIQEALVREHYLNVPSGKWDDATQQALRRYQADQGWQSKSVPDSRALIRLGLGPDHGHLLNPETAMTMSMEPRLQRTSHVTSRAAVSAPDASPSRNSAPSRSISPSSSQSLPVQNSTSVATPAITAPALSPAR